MAPILLKIKGTKLFSPFNEIEDVGDLSTLWRVCTKVKDSLENGSRLENLSWRLWHLHQTLEARGKGKDYRKLSPATTRQLEKTIRRPDNVRSAKPMQIKVRLGKSSGDSRPGEPAPTPANGRVRSVAAATTTTTATASDTDLASLPGANADSSSAATCSDDTTKDNGAPAAPRAFGVNSADRAGASAVPTADATAPADDSLLSKVTGPQPEPVAGSGVPLLLTDTSSTSAPPAYVSHAAGIMGSGLGSHDSNHCSHSNQSTLNTNGTHGCPTSTPAVDHSEEAQASDFMSFGP
ncbi:hypothetical protein GGI02_005982, partial [Coemansia sp. RSA 2322]